MARPMKCERCGTYYYKEYANQTLEYTNYILREKSDDCNRSVGLCPDCLKKLYDWFTKEA